jgi:hypothetical protein
MLWFLTSCLTEGTCRSRRSIVFDTYRGAPVIILRTLDWNRSKISINMEKYCRAGQATYENMTHAHCMLNTNRRGDDHTKAAQQVFTWQCATHETPPVCLDCTGG